ncbi:MAG: TolC family protein [Gammaproteobacteria bacterium]
MTESISVIALYRDRLLPLVRDNLNAAQADYRAGTGTFRAVITAENQKLMTELRLARVRADYVRRTALLARWSGGGWRRALAGKARNR